jgi:hypothetical protein
MNEYNEMIDECIDSAFKKLPNSEQNTLLYLCRKINSDRSKPLNENSKVEILGKLGIWLAERMPKSLPKPYVIVNTIDQNYYWNNDKKEWVKNFYKATRYTTKERFETYLIEDGAWIENEEGK